MRLKILYIPLCLLLAVPATAQNETMRKVQTKEKKESAINTESINKTIKPIGNKTETMLPYYKEKEEERAIERESIRLKISIPHQYYETTPSFHSPIRSIFILSQTINATLILQTTTSLISL